MRKNAYLMIMICALFMCLDHSLFASLCLVLERHADRPVTTTGKFKV